MLKLTLKALKAVLSYLRPHFCLFYSQVPISEELMKLLGSLILYKISGIFMNMHIRFALQTDTRP